MLRTVIFALIAAQVACVARPKTVAPPQAAARPVVVSTVSVDLPEAAWVSTRLDEVAQFNALRGAEPLARTPLPAGESEVRVYLRSGPRRPMIQIHRGPAGVRGEMWLWWWYAGGQEHDWTSAELDAWVACGDRRRHGDWSACRPQPRAPVDWAAALGRLEALRVWSLPDQSRFTKPSDVDGQLVLVEVRDGPHYRVYHWDVSMPIEAGPGAGDSSAAIGLWDLVWEIVSAAEHLE